MLVMHILPLANHYDGHSEQLLQMGFSLADSAVSVINTSGSRDSVTNTSPPDSWLPLPLSLLACLL